MNRTQKEQFVTQFAEGIQKSQAFALMSFSKINVEKMTEFRLELRKKNVRVKVVKNTLARRVFGDTEFKDLLNHFTGPTLVAYGEGESDPVVTAKAIWDWVKKEDFNVDVKGGVALGQVVGRDEMQRLSALPGREQLLVSFIFALKHHPTRFLYALKDAPSRLAYAMVALKGKKEQE